MYYGHICNHDHLPDLEDPDFISREDALSFVRKVYQGAYKDGSFDKKRVSAYAHEFGKAVTKGYLSGGGNITPDFDTPDQKMLDALRNNVFHFSAAKNRTEIEALSNALRDEKGKLRSYKDFVTEAEKITSDFQGRYMKTEYNMAVNAATMAARWTEFEPGTILVYKTAGDNRVRPEHRALDGIAKPKEDPFWDTYYPPLSWNCRCTVVPSTSGRITPDDQIPADAIDGVPPIFRTNFAKDGWAFPPDHPYFETKIKPDLHPWSWGEAAYKTYHESNIKGTVWQTDLRYQATTKIEERIRKEIEWQTRLTAAEKLADLYETDVYIPPTFHNETDWRYNYFYKDVPILGKQPDLFFNNEWWEIESYEKGFKYGKISHMLEEGAKQSPNVILKIKHNVPFERLKDKIQDSINKATKGERKNIRKVLVLDKNGKIYEVLL